jgi:adenosine deaminase
MDRSSTLRQLLMDDKSTSEYFAGTPVKFEDVRRRVFLLRRNEKREIPDHHFRLELESAFEGIDSIGSMLFLGTRRLANQHLFFEGNRIYVTQQAFPSWHSLLTYMPPLVLQSSLLHEHAYPSTIDSQKLSAFFIEFILPNTKFSALPQPSILQLRAFVRQKSGLHDLHMHLNGATETDQVWQDYLKNPDAVFNELSRAYSENEKVREHIEQESHFLKPTELRALLIIARRIRLLFYDIIVTKDDNVIRRFHSTTALLQSLTDTRNGVFPESHTHPFVCLVSNNTDYPYLMAVEALMYTMIFEQLSRDSDELLSSLFHFYLLALGEVNRLLVQQWHQYGFEQFQKHTLNGLREDSERDYKKRFLQIAGNDLRNLNFLEGRFSPKKSEKETIELLRDIESGWRVLHDDISEIYADKESRLKPTLALIGHFIKRPERIKDPFVRHKDLRVDTWDRATILALVLKNYPKYAERVKGIDAAASEFDAPPEVFGPTFRFMRRNGIRHFTYHAGEDFFHISSGLRAVYEAILFCDLRQGDRIGHATATGLDVNYWKQTVGKKILISRGEWLDNLIFIHHLIVKEDIQDLEKHLPQISFEIQSLSSKIYRQTFQIRVLEDAWLARKFCPILLFAGRNRSDASLLSIFNEEEWIDQNNAVNSDETLDALKLYHSNSTRPDYQDTIEVETCKLLSVDDYTLIQKALLRVMHNKEIVIETLPTSNIRIGQHYDYLTYQLWNWMNWEDKGHQVPPIVVGSDDTGIFATNIFNEYAHIYCYLTGPGNLTHHKAMDVIRRLDDNSRIYRFEN